MSDRFSWSALYSRWLKLTAPNDSVTNSADRIRAQALTSVLFAIFFLGIFIEIEGFLFEPEFGTYVVIEVPAIILIGILGYFSRTRFYQWVALLSAGLVTVATLLVTVISEYPPSIVFLTISYFIVATVLSRTAAFVVALLNLVIVASIAVFNPSWQSWNMIFTELIFLLLATIVVYAMMIVQGYYIDQNEANSHKLRESNKLLEEQLAVLEAVQVAQNESLKNFAKIFHSNPDPIVINRMKDGKFIDYNSSFLSSMGYTSSDLRNLVGADMFADAETAKRYYDILRKDHRMYSIEMDFKTKSGEIRSALVSAEVIEWNGEQCVVVSARDITLRKVAEERELAIQKERQRAEILQKFITDASHDFRTPLATITTSVYILQNSAKMDRQSYHLAKIDKQVERIGKLVDGLMLMSLLDSNQAEMHLQAVDVRMMIQDLVNSTPNPKNHTITLDLPEKSLRVTADSYYLRTALGNMIDNAYLFTPGEGQISIKLSADNQFVKIQISDNGSGMDAGTIERVFERLYRGDDARNQETGGAGLGLSIAWKIIQHHNGKIDVSSELNKGSQFTVTLPVRVENAPEIVLQ